MDPLGLLAIEDKASLAMDLADVRILLEPGIAELAALHATEEDIQTIVHYIYELEIKLYDALNGGEYHD